jgi:hypothetical protein
MDVADLEARLAVFGGAWGLFDALVEELGDSAADELTHAELEERIAAQGREVMRQMLRDRLDLRLVREPRRGEVVGADQVVRRRIEPGRERQSATVFGTVAVTGIACRAPLAANVHPVDAALNLPIERAGFGLRKLAAIEAVVRGSFDGAETAIERATGTRIGKRQIQRLTERAAVVIEAFYRQAPPLSTRPNSATCATSAPGSSCSTEPTPRSGRSRPEPPYGAFTSTSCATSSTCSNTCGRLLGASTRAETRPPSMHAPSSPAGPNPCSPISGDTPPSTA